MDHGPYEKGEWSKGWTIELGQGPGPAKKPRLSDPEFDFTLLQNIVHEFENANPTKVWSLAEKQAKPEETTRVDQKAKDETPQEGAPRVADWVPSWKNSLPIPAWLVHG